MRRLPFAPFNIACGVKYIIPKRMGKNPISLKKTLINADLNILIDDIPMTSRAMRGLKSKGIKYIGDLLKESETSLLKIPDIGWKSLKSIKECLSERGLHLGMTK